MNIRVDDTKIREIAKSGKAEAREKAEVGVQEAAAGQAEGVKAGRAVSLQQTKVDAPFFREESQMEKIQQAAQQEELQQFRKKMETVCNTASEKDCGLMEEDGFPMGSTGADTIVTEMDKIKMELAQAGADISIFGDALSGRQLEEMTGSAALANQLESAIQKADLPVTEENLSGCQEALAWAASLTASSPEMVKYMVENELPPTVENLYKAQHSVSGAPYAAPPAVPMDDSLRAQVGQVIAQAGLTADETVMEYSQWMLDHQVPVTAENLKYAMDLHKMQLPPDEGQVIGAMTEAIAEGGQPADAVILEGYSLSGRAARAMEAVAQATDAEVWSIIEKGLPLTIESLAAAHNSQMAENQAAGATGEGGAAAGRAEGTGAAVGTAGAIGKGNAAAGRAEGTGAAGKGGETAVSAKDQTTVSLEASQDIRLISARRQLEEARLMMTVQANYALLKRGISIETKPLEDVVAQLKALEDDYYRSLLAQNGIEATEENTDLFAGTIRKAQELKSAPAYILGKISPQTDPLEEVHAMGMARQAELERAGEAYEALRTEPRADLGDSIQKAFQNVDDILRDLGLDTSGPNQRAVRILAYNQMEITESSIVQMKAADQKVQNLFQNLSPAVVMEMIREGANPLEMSVDQLNAKAEEIKSRMDLEGGEKFSKFLYKLEQRQEITPQERDSYIGIYRLLRQIDKTDGAVVGALVRQGAELTMKNLLSAVRTNRAAGVNVSVDDSFGEAEEIRTADLSISQQIESAYQTDCAKGAFAMVTPEGIQQAQAGGDVSQMTPEELLWQLRQAEPDLAAEESYYRQQLQEFSQAREAEAQVLQMLNGHDMPLTAYNIMAATRILEGRNVFKSLFSHEGLGQEIDLEEVKEALLEDFAEAVKTPEEMAEAQEKLAEVAENVMKTMIESPDIRNMDLREMKILHQQIELGTRLSKEETYAIPVLVADELTNVQLKIVRGKKERGRLDIIFDSPRLGKVAASFQVQPDSVRGFLVSDSRKTVETLRSREESLRSRLEQGEDAQWEMNCIHSSRVELPGVPSREPISQPDRESESYQVQTKALYGMAKAFLEELKHFNV